MLCAIGAIAKKYGVSPSKIRRWAAKGLIQVACRTFGGHRRLQPKRLYEYSGSRQRARCEGETVIV